MIIVEVFARGSASRGPPSAGAGIRIWCDDYPCRPVAASVRRNISFPAPRPFHPDACKRRWEITDQSSSSHRVQKQRPIRNHQRPSALSDLRKTIHGDSRSDAKSP